MTTIRELQARNTKAITAILLYVEDLQAGKVEHDRSKFLALLTEYGAVNGSMAMATVREEMLAQEERQDWRGPEEIAEEQAARAERGF